MGNSRFETEDWSKPKVTGKLYKLRGGGGFFKVHYFSHNERGDYRTNMVDLEENPEAKPVITNIPSFIDLIDATFKKVAGVPGLIVRVTEKDLKLIIEYKREVGDEWKTSPWFEELVLEEVT